MSDNNIQISVDKRTLQLLGFILAVAAALYLVNNNPLTDQGSKATPSASASFPASITVASFGPAIVTKEELLDQSKAFGFPVYWNDVMPDTQIELTVTADGKFYVRYLPTGVEAGSKDKFLTIATMYDPNAYATLQGLTAQAGARWSTYAGGALAAAASETDPNIYFAYQGYPLLIDVYSPDPAFGWKLVDAGSVKILNGQAL